MERVESGRKARCTQNTSGELWIGYKGDILEYDETSLMVAPCMRRCNRMTNLEIDTPR